MTIGDLVTENEPPSPATRAEIRAVIDKCERAFTLLYDALNSCGEILEDARALLARGDDEPAATDPSAEEQAS